MAELGPNEEPLQERTGGSIRIRGLAWLLTVSVVLFLFRFGIFVFSSRQLELETLPQWNDKGIGIIVTNRAWRVGRFLFTVDPSWSVSTCFLVTKTGGVLTARHAVDRALRDRFCKIWVRFKSTPWLAARILWLDPDQDLAALRVNLPSRYLETVFPLALADSDLALAPGTEVKLVGFPHAKSYVQGFRLIRQMAEHSLSYLGRWVPGRKGGSVSGGPDVELFRGAGGAGFSGSPVLTHSGRVVGLYFGHRVAGGQEEAVVVPRDALWRAFRLIQSQGEPLDNAPRGVPLGKRTKMLGGGYRQLNHIGPYKAWDGSISE
ncbi:S1 family peptidase [Candidatus Methylacidithermus pantelleriae]|uniref:Serine protease n=1 Tax=Candidatus Methylacidithermus pantelleriae TaxID=2744239 RepID=A0A8J2FN66_9BACT|nr:serine protease [Candidatus Methylacidithermus pantelleriae]CAF0693534.1 hypothetical protein MPNT_140034 [Candidatus Methylacidithermus pantelleriae]